MAAHILATRKALLQAFACDGRHGAHACARHAELRSVRVLAAQRAGRLAQLATGGPIPSELAVAPPVNLVAYAVLAAAPNTVGVRLGRHEEVRPAHSIESRRAPRPAQYR
eukprot:scaffold14669_cov72-Phaeocystis_antarctica.AAC.1